jgi:hypothetical protein
MVLNFSSVRGGEGFDYYWSLPLYWRVILLAFAGLTDTAYVA